MGLQTFSDPHGVSIEARQCLLDKRCERNHPKRHRTKGRAKRLTAAKRDKIKHKLALRQASDRRYDEAVSAYWRGERDGHP